MNTGTSFLMSQATCLVGLSAVALLLTVAGCHRLPEQAATPRMRKPPAQASMTSPPPQGTSLPMCIATQAEGVASSTARAASCPLVATLSTQRMPAIKAPDRQCAVSSAQALITEALRQQDSTEAIAMCFTYVFDNVGPVDESLITMLKGLLQCKLDLGDENLVHATIGRCYNRLDRFDEALRYLEEVSARSTPEANNAFAHEFYGVKLASYYGLRAQLKKAADKYSIEEYYQALGPYEEGIIAVSSQLGLARQDQGRDIEAEAYISLDSYMRLRPEHQAQYLRSARDRVSDKRISYLSHQKLLRFLALVDEQKKNMDSSH